MKRRPLSRLELSRLLAETIPALAGVGKNISAAVAKMLKRGKVELLILAEVKRGVERSKKRLEELRGSL
jgi:hypothetical protein